MASLLFLLTVTSFIVKINSAESVYSDNGWRPISNEKVLGELRRNFIKMPASVQNQAMRNYPGYVPDNVILKGDRIIIQPKEINKEFLKYNDAYVPVKTNYEKWANVKDSMESTNEKMNDIVSEKNDAKQRKAKRITETDTINFKKSDSNDLLDITKSNENIDEIENTKKSANYEVTENNKNDLLASNQEIHFAKGYIYDFPKTNTESPRKNFSSNLFDILANYNIRTSDMLPNYAISLRQNSRHSDEHEYMFMKVPIRIPLRYNNANHLAVDPILAVLLSNYGHYLPGQYGFQRNYNNLYGYLASNNIHNNKPFGSYKLFPDTDSSN